MSSFAQKVLKWYIDDIWTEKMVRDAYRKGRITEGELAEILSVKEILSAEDDQSNG